MTGKSRCSPRRSKLESATGAIAKLQLPTLPSSTAPSLATARSTTRRHEPATLDDRPRSRLPRTGRCSPAPASRFASTSSDTSGRIARARLSTMPTGPTTAVRSSDAFSTRVEDAALAGEKHARRCVLRPSTPRARGRTVTRANGSASFARMTDVVALAAELLTIDSSTGAESGAVDFVSNWLVARGWNVTLQEVTTRPRQRLGVARRRRRHALDAPRHRAAVHRAAPRRRPAARPRRVRRQGNRRGDARRRRQPRERRREARRPAVRRRRREGLRRRARGEPSPGDEQVPRQRRADGEQARERREGLAARHRAHARPRRALRVRASRRIGDQADARAAADARRRSSCRPTTCSATRRSTSARSAAAPRRTSSRRSCEAELMFRLVGDVDAAQASRSTSGRRARPSSSSARTSPRSTFTRSPGSRSRRSRTRRTFRCSAGGARRCCSARARSTSRTRRTSSSTSRAARRGRLVRDDRQERCSPHETHRSSCRTRRERHRVAVLGATGAVGQAFIRLLADHPWFELAEARGVGAFGGKAVRRSRALDRRRRRCRRHVATMTVLPCDPARSVAPTSSSRRSTPSAAGDAEPAFARAGKIVLSNAKNYRMEPDVPLVIAEVNPDHLDVLDAQRQKRGWTRRHRHERQLLGDRRGAAARADASERSASSKLFVVDDAGGLRRRLSRRAVARHPRQRHSVHRRRRAEDRDRDRRSSSGARDGDTIASARRSPVSAHANRVPVEHGHTVCMSIELETQGRRGRRRARDRRLARRRATRAACRARPSARSS